MTTNDDGPLLLTPGPLTTSRATKTAMLRDWGARDDAFLTLTARVRVRLLEIAGGVDTHTVVLLQGSGTFAVEAMLGTFVPRDGRVLILTNGAYGRRMQRICEVISRPATVLETPEDTPPAPDAVAMRLDADPTITHVAVVHCETTSGILNPLPQVADVVTAAGRRLLVDAMSTFGAIPIDAGAIRYDALVSSFNKCLEGVPGAAFVIARREALEEAAGRAHSFALDLHDQWRYMDRTGQWRFTPPTHVIAALHSALVEHAVDGGVEGRGTRYRRNCRLLRDGMRAMGFNPMLPESLQAPIIVTFHAPQDPRFDFAVFYSRLRQWGYLIYPGKLTEGDSFRVGCIGDLDERDIQGFLYAARQVLEEMGVQFLIPAIW
jgi:2-aminoethylphosphonate-pyruvate transaminase